MYADYAAELNDNVLDVVDTEPGLNAKTIARRLKADAGAIRRTLGFLVTSHYLTQTGKGGRETYARPGR
jgi:DNA-binding IclR family transcriptional regulator